MGSGAPVDGAGPFPGKIFSHVASLVPDTAIPSAASPSTFLMPAARASALPMTQSTPESGSSPRATSSANGAVVAVLFSVPPSQSPMGTLVPSAPTRPTSTLPRSAPNAPSPTSAASTDCSSTTERASTAAHAPSRSQSNRTTSLKATSSTMDLGLSSPGARATDRPGVRVGRDRLRDRPVRHCWRAREWDLLQQLRPRRRQHAGLTQTDHRAWLRTCAVSAAARRAPLTGGPRRCPSDIQMIVGVTNEGPGSR
jgi:hypothetical protein